MNKVNILSNELDQAPKTKENWYQERLDAMKDVIYKAFDQLVVFDGDEIITDRIKKKWRWTSSYSPQQAKRWRDTTNWTQKRTARWKTRRTK